jgi:hypothetical protein
VPQAYSGLLGVAAGEGAGVTSGSLWHSPAAGRAGWLFVAGRSFIAAVNAGAADTVIERLWHYADVHNAAVEDVVGALPLGVDGGVHSFAIVSFAAEPRQGAAECTITAVVRGSAVVDVFSVGGSRRFSAGTMQPWMLADFRSVTAVVLGGDDQPTGPVVRAGVGALPLGTGVVHGDRLLWSLLPVAFAPAGPAPVDFAPAGTDTAAFAPALRADAARADLSGRADDQRLGDIDNDATIIAVRGRARSSDVDDDTVLMSRGGRTASASPAFASAPPKTQMDEAPFWYRLAGAQPQPLNRPIVFGRSPGLPRIGRGDMPLLVTVDSPDAAVSSTHLRIEQQGSSVVVTDLRSTNGTIVRPAQGPRRLLRPGEAVVVLVGTTIDIGDGNIIEIMPRESIPEPASSPGSMSKGSV